MWPQEIGKCGSQVSWGHVPIIPFSLLQAKIASCLIHSLTQEIGWKWKRADKVKTWLWGRGRDGGRIVLLTHTWIFSLPILIKFQAMHLRSRSRLALWSSCVSHLTTCLVHALTLSSSLFICVTVCSPKDSIRSRGKTVPRVSRHC